jgi:hypothetical protein
VVVPFRGEWELTVTTFTSDVDSFQVSTPVGIG